MKQPGRTTTQRWPTVNAHRMRAADPGRSSTVLGSQVAVKVGAPEDAVVGGNAGADAADRPFGTVVA